MLCFGCQVSSGTLAMIILIMIDLKYYKYMYGLTKTIINLVLKSSQKFIMYCLSPKVEKSQIDTDNYSQHIIMHIV